MPEGKYWWIFLVGSLGGLLGGLFGILVGFVIGITGAALNLAYWVTFIFSFLGIGGLLFWFVLPIENRCFWLKVTGRSAYLNKADKWQELYKFAPITFFFIVGVSIGVNYGYQF